MQRKGSAEWNGGLKEGRGRLSTESGVLDNVAYDFSRRFEDEAGTNPEELIGAAHAACFSMAFSAQLEGAGHVPESVKTTADVTLEKLEGGFGITKIHLTSSAKVPTIDEEQFKSIAENAKRTCPVSKVLNAEITLSASLE